MSIMPFVSLGIGICLGLIIQNKKIIKFTDILSTVALIVLMLTIGIGIGLDESIVKRFGSIGFNCIIIAIFAISFSVVLTVICEKTVLPLKVIDEELALKEMALDVPNDGDKEDENISSLVWIMPISIILGLIFGIIFRKEIPVSYTDHIFTIALVILYICVGVSQGTNKEVFHFIKLLGAKILWLSVAIMMGSVLGGIVAGLLLDIPPKIPVVAASGMSFYSLTGAYMTQTFGLEFGTYGFIVNVLREFITIVLMPMLIKISSGSPIAGGAAGNMDTMLAPITKFVGVRLGLVTLITGTILTFIVPFLLPIMTWIFG